MSQTSNSIRFIDIDNKENVLFQLKNYKIPDKNDLFDKIKNNVDLSKSMLQDMGYELWLADNIIRFLTYGNLNALTWTSD
jgi:hypothetical protein